MAGPTVTLTFAGDSAKLTDTIDKTGSAVENMGRKVGSASEKMQTTGRSVDDLADKAGTGEQRFQGLSDVIVGTGDVMTGFREGDVIGMAQGFADLAGGMEGFLIPMIGQVATGLKFGVGGAMSFIAAHPLAITLIALAALFVVLWTQSETFRNIVIGVFNTVSGFIRSVFGGTIGWIIDRWNDVVGFFSKHSPRC